MRKNLFGLAIAVSFISVIFSFFLLNQGQEELTISLKTSEIQPETGCAYFWKLRVKPKNTLLFQFSGDDPKKNSSKLTLFENNIKLGEAHTTHQVIRKDSKGFSHWHDTLYFAASDCSDPRTNGKSYTVHIASSYTNFALLTFAPFYFFVVISIASIFVYAFFKLTRFHASITSIKENPIFSTFFLVTLFFSMIFIYAFGFYEMVEVNSVYPERLRDFTFALWEKHPVKDHGFLVFLNLSDFENRVAYGGYGPPYLSIMYFFYKIETFFPFLKMRALFPFVSMLIIALILGFAILKTRTNKITPFNGVLTLSSVAFLFTTPMFWICAGKHNVDNFHITVLPLILILAIKHSQGEIKWGSAWPGYSLLALLSPIHGAVYGFYLWVSSIKDKTIDPDFVKTGCYLISISILIYLIPTISQKLLGFHSSSSSWLHRAGLDGNDQWDGNVLSAIFTPRPIPRNSILMLFFPALILGCQIVHMWFLKQGSFSSSPNQPNFLNARFYGFLFASYLITCLLWPQSVSIHPYLYDFHLLGPIAVCIALHFGILNYWKSTNPIWIWIILFGIMFNLNQLASSSASLSGPCFNGC